MSRRDRKAQRQAYRAERKDKYKEFIIDESIPMYQVSSGIYVVDKALHKGYPFGRFIGIYGGESSGKTTSALRALGQINLINWDTGKYDPSYSNPCGCQVNDLELSFIADWGRKIGFDEDLDENEVNRIVGGENVGDIVKDAIDSDMYSGILIDSFEPMMPLHILEDTIQMNEQGRRAQLLAKCFRKWVPALMQSARRNRETPWRCPCVMYTNHAQYKLMTMYPELVVPGGKSQRHYASIEIMLTKFKIQDDTKKEFGRGKMKGSTLKNKCTGHAGMTFSYEMALKELDGLSVGDVDNAKSILADMKSFDQIEKVKEGVKILGETYRIQSDFKKKMYAEPDFEREVWNKMLEITGK